jgi:RNA polymerase sigma-70 factor (ECF subfamily)
MHANESAKLSQSSGGNSNDTATLVQRIRSGDNVAREALFRRYLPLLRRWASGRLPKSARDLADTDDLVQVTLMRALNRIETFQVNQKGCFLAYLRQIFINEVRQEIKHCKRVPGSESISDEMRDDDLPTVLEQLVGVEQLQSYQLALGTLTKRQQEVLVMRIEFGMTYPEIALETGRSADAVRIMVARATVELGRRLGGYRDQIG